MPPLTLRQEFPTLRHFKEALHSWAIEAHFEPRILKSDTGRVRVGCKRDPNCPFVVRCNWERRHGHEPLARVTVLRAQHTCVNGLEWRGLPVGEPQDSVMPQGLGLQQQSQQEIPQLEIRTDPSTGSIIGGARILGHLPPRSQPPSTDPALIPALPKVQRNAASRLPFLMDILPKLMRITKETTPTDIRECLRREYGQEVHLQQCRRAKTEILKRHTSGAGNTVEADLSQGDNNREGGQNLDGIGDSDSGEANNTIFNHGPEESPCLEIGSPNGNPGSVGLGVNINDNPNGPDGAENAFPLQTASGVVISQSVPRRQLALDAMGEQPVRCPYCVNHRWMRTIRDAVEHMSMHVVV